MLLWTLLASGQIAMRKIDGSDRQASVARNLSFLIDEKMETESPVASDRKIILDRGTPHLE
jgi:hypothetical protein